MFLRGIPLLICTALAIVAMAPPALAYNDIECYQINGDVGWHEGQLIADTNCIVWDDRVVSMLRWPKLYLWDASIRYTISYGISICASNCYHDREPIYQVKREYTKTGGSSFPSISLTVYWEDIPHAGDWIVDANVYCWIGVRAHTPNRNTASGYVIYNARPNWIQLVDARYDQYSILSIVAMFFF